jgi:hypothetical protein
MVEARPARARVGCSLPPPARLISHGDHGREWARVAGYVNNHPAQSGRAKVPPRRGSLGKTEKGKKPI